jgi:transcriptional activator of cad operon
MSIECLVSTNFCVGDWVVKPAIGEMSRADSVVRLEDRSLRLLLCLVEHADQVLSIDDLMKHVWQGVIVTPDSIYQAITSLRRQLGDDPKQPTYIATVPRRGYRLIATVKIVPDEEVSVDKVLVDTLLPNADSATVMQPKPVFRRAVMLPVAAFVVLAACLGSIPVITGHATADVPAVVATLKETPRSVAVLPFVDLTDQMSEEPFADGMVEELINKLSKVPGLAVSPPASSFYFKEKRVTVAEIAKTLHVAFVLDGSVRKSGSTLRVASRLTRVSDGFVIWSESYDRSWSDKLKIQDDIASEVSKALAKSIQ